MNAKWICAAALALCLAIPARAEIALPAGLTALEAEAFAGDAAVEEIALPEGLESIGDRAFSGCGALGWITVPRSVTTLGADCFDGCAEDLLIRTTADAAAVAYARLYNIDYQAGTRYRALLIGQSYADSDMYMELEGPENDIAAMSRCLSALGDTPYAPTVRRELTGAGILAAVDEVFGDATDRDVSLFFYSGHGDSGADTQGALVGVDGELVTASRLRAKLDGVPGRKIIVLDACYSGSIIGAATRSARSANATGGGAAFVESFVRAFSMRSRSGGAGSYFIITAASDDEESYEDYVGRRVMGLFTACVARGLGFDCKKWAAADMAADANGNGVVTLDELYGYAYPALVVEEQHVQVSPAGCAWFGLARQ